MLGTSQQAVFPILTGSHGRNGKSTLFGILHELLGDYAGTFSSSLIVRSKYSDNGESATPAKMKFYGSRLMYSSEISKSESLNVESINSLTGRDMMSGRNLHQNTKEWSPTHTMFLLCNDLPYADGTVDAFWRRACIIPFELTFVENPKRNFERKANINIRRDLMQNTSGILNWLILGLKNYQKVGLQIPEQCRRATSDYQESEDILGQCLKQICVFGSDEKVQAKNLLNGVNDWWQKHFDKNIGSKFFGSEMVKRFTRTQNWKGISYEGLRLKTAEEVEKSNRENPSDNMSATEILSDGDEKIIDDYDKSFERKNGTDYM